MLSTRQMYQIWQLGIATYGIHSFMSGDNYSALSTGLALYEALFPTSNDSLMAVVHTFAAHDAFTELSACPANIGGVIELSALSHLPAACFRADHVAANTLRSARQVRDNLYAWWHSVPSEADTIVNDPDEQDAGLTPT